jgi:hypothetical protein
LIATPKQSVMHKHTMVNLSILNSILFLFFVDGKHEAERDCAKHYHLRERS